MTTLTSDDIARSIQARHLLTSMSEAVCFASSDRQSWVYEVLSGQDFDNAPVMADGFVVGYVSRDDTGSTDESSEDVPPSVEVRRWPLLVQPTA